LNVKVSYLVSNNGFYVFAVRELYYKKVVNCVGCPTFR